VSEEQKKVVKAVKAVKAVEADRATEADRAAEADKAVKVKKVLVKVAEPKGPTELTPDLFVAPVSEEPIRDIPLSAPKAESALAAVAEPDETPKATRPFWQQLWFWLLVIAFALSVYTLATKILPAQHSGDTPSTAVTTVTTPNGPVELTASGETPAGEPGAPAAQGGNAAQGNAQGNAAQGGNQAQGNAAQGGNEASWSPAPNSNGAQGNSNGAQGNASPQGNSGTKEDTRSLLYVTVTMPKTFFEGQSRAEIEAGAKEAGYSKVVIHDDGPVSYTMTKLKQAQIKRQFKRQINTTVHQMTAGGKDMPKSYKSISYDDDITKFDVRVDRAVFDSDMMEPMYAYALYLLGGYYQMFDGRSESQVDVTVNFIDDSNGQVFQSGNYQQAMQQMNALSF